MLKSSKRASAKIKQADGYDYKEPSYDDRKESEVVTNAHNQKKKHRRWHWHWPPTKKEMVIGSVVLVVVIGAGLWWFVFRSQPKPVAVTTHHQTKIAEPAIILSDLTGLPVSTGVNQLPVTGVMIENSDYARPQSGLSQAGIVFEALAEGGITRFLAIYQNNQGGSIGPVRSARPYFIDWLLPFDAGYAHAGGSPAALNDIQSLKIRDMNEFYNGSSFTRISSREAPHNLYTTLAQLSSLEKSKGWTSSSFTSFPRKADAPSKTPTVTSIDFNISTTDMEVHYQYDPTNNTYLRSEGGAPMIDADTNQQLNPKVVVAMVVPWTDGPLDSSGAYYTDYSDIGTGTAYIFQDGGITQGVWDKPLQSSQIQFKTAAGAPINFDAGQTWITALGSTPDLTYK